VSDEGGDATEPAESRFHASLGPPFRRLATASCLRSAAPGSTLTRNNRRCALGKQPPPDTADRGSHSQPTSSPGRVAAENPGTAPLAQRSSDMRVVFVLLALQLMLIHGQQELPDGAMIQPSRPLAPVGAIVNPSAFSGMLGVMPGKSANPTLLSAQQWLFRVRHQ
jgi:hypothetical protein